MTVAVVTPVYRTGGSLERLAERLDACMGEAGTDDDWTLRLVVDACPDGSGMIADAVAARHPAVRVQHLPVNVGQHRAIAAGLAAEVDADVWVCLDSDLQDPPEALPRLLDALRTSGAGAVFAGRRGTYQRTGRLLTGSAHRMLLTALTGLPADAGAFFAMDRKVRDAVVDGVLLRGCPSVVVAAGASGRSVRSVPVPRAVRDVGDSSWTSAARVRQSLATIRWSVRAGRPVGGRR